MFYPGDTVRKFKHEINTSLKMNTVYFVTNFYEGLKDCSIHVEEKESSMRNVLYAKSMGMVTFTYGCAKDEFISCRGMLIEKL